MISLLRLQVSDYTCMSLYELMEAYIGHPAFIMWLLPLCTSEVTEACKSELGAVKFPLAR